MQKAQLTRAASGVAADAAARAADYVDQVGTEGERLAAQAADRLSAVSRRLEARSGRTTGRRRLAMALVVVFLVVVWLMLRRARNHDDRGSVERVAETDTEGREAVRPAS